MISDVIDDLTSVDDFYVVARNIARLPLRSCTLLVVLTMEMRPFWESHPLARPLGGMHADVSYGHAADGCMAGMRFALYQVCPVLGPARFPVRLWAVSHGRLSGGADWV